VGKNPSVLIEINAVRGALGDPMTPPIIERFVSRVLADVQFQRFR